MLEDWVQWKNCRTPGRKVENQSAEGSSSPPERVVFLSIELRVTGLGEELRLTGSRRQLRKIHLGGDLRDSVLGKGSGERQRVQCFGHSSVARMSPKTSSSVWWSSFTAATWGASWRLVSLTRFAYKKMNYKRVHKKLNHCETNFLSQVVKYQCFVKLLSDSCRHAMYPPFK